jgi:hypothetical protein
MNDLKSIRISITDNKSPRINTSSTCSNKPSRINTSKKHPGEGEGVRDDADGNDANREIGAPKKGKMEA